MTIEDPAIAAIAADLESPRFRVGVRRRYWRIVSYTFPVLVMAVSAIKPDGQAAEFGFRYELSGFPSIAPRVEIWDLEKGERLALDKRPKGQQRVNEAFKDWGQHTVYRPWERDFGAHGDWVHKYPALIWNPGRDLAFTLEDLHELLNLHPRTMGSGQAA